MRPIKPNTRHRPLWRTVLLAFLAIVIGGAVTVAALAGLKVIDPAKLAFWRQKVEPIPADWVPVPVPVRAIPAYTMVTKDFLINPKTGAWEVVWSPPNLVPKSAILEVGKIRGRVMAHEKPPFYCFTEKDFLPEGTHPGVVAGTPEGKRAITLDPGKLKGVFGLREGDHVDVLADIPVDKLSWFGGPEVGRSVILAQPVSLGEHPDKQRTETRVLARDAMIVTPVTTRAKPVVSSSLTQGPTTRTVPVQEIVLAVGEEEVARVTKALDWDLGMMCAARSGRPEAKDAEPTPPGAVAVPVLVREVPAFSELTEADFRDSVTQRVRYESASLTEVNRRGIVPNVSDLVGRVVKRLMPVGRMIVEEDLLPKGAPPGMTGGIQQDRQAMGIEAAKIPGIEGLRAGDRLDVVASFDLEQEQQRKETERLNDGTVRVIESRRSAIRSTRLSSEASLGGRAEHWYVAIDAELIVPVGTAVNPPAATAPNDKQKPQVVIAMDPRDVPSMAQALAAKDIVLAAVARPAGKPRASAGKPSAPPGMVTVPAAPKGLPAFEPLTRESLRNLDTRREEWRVLDAPTIAEEHVITDPERLLGRILNKEKRQGEFFVEADFLPAWVKPGLVARVPVGKRAIVIDLVERESEEKVERSQYSETKTKTDRERHRIEELEQATDGTHLDILVSRPVQYGSNFEVRSVGHTLANRMRVAPVVRDGVLLYHTLTQALLAVEPAEVAPLEEALASRAGLRAVFYSGQTPDSKSEPALSGYDGTGGAKMIEMLIGDKQKVFVFDSAK
ncbi:MAG: hypothetical protein ACLP9L_21705 [Thermoguttaceae bacterium]